MNEFEKGTIFSSKQGKVKNIDTPHEERLIEKDVQLVLMNLSVR